MGTSILTYWYYHVPNFVLAALMYTLLGRVVLGMFVDADSPNYIWRFFCRITDPVVAAVALVTPKAAAPVVIWLFGVVWLFWLRVGFLILFTMYGFATRSCESVRHIMDRNFYYVGIAFFGMINGLFNQALVPFAYLFAKVLAPALLFGSESLTLMFASLMASTATIIVGGIPAAIYERYVGAKDDSTEVSLWIWLAGTAILTLPAIGNFFQSGSEPTVRAHAIVSAPRGEKIAGSNGRDRGSSAKDRALEHMRRIAYETVLRACGFGSLAIFCVMIGMSFEPRLAFQAGGTLTTLMACILIYKAREALTKDYRRPRCGSTSRRISARPRPMRSGRARPSCATPT